MRSFFGPVRRAGHFTAAPVLRSPPIFSSSASAPANRVTCGDRNAGALIKSKGCDRTSYIEWPRFRAPVKCRPQHRDSAIVRETLQDSIVGPRAQIQFRHRNWGASLQVFGRSPLSSIRPRSSQATSSSAACSSSYLPFRARFRAWYLGYTLWRSYLRILCEECQRVCRRASLGFGRLSKMEARKGANCRCGGSRTTSARWLKKD
jgi:hypothetical protein